MTSNINLTHYVDQGGLKPAEDPPCLCCPIVMANGGSQLDTLRKKELKWKLPQSDYTVAEFVGAFVGCDLI